MADEKKYSAKEAAVAVLKKAEEVLKKSEFLKKSAEIPDKASEEKDATPAEGVREQAAPEKNPKEQAEGNNELAGTTPTQVGQDGKNVPGFDEMHSALKLAKFIGHIESKRKAKAKVPGAM